MLDKMIRFVRNITEWIAYVAEMPAVNGFGTSAAQALAAVQAELNRYGKTAGRKFTVQPTKLKYQMAHHKGQPALP
jgi:pantoate kinase